MDPEPYRYCYTFLSVNIISTNTVIVGLIVIVILLFLSAMISGSEVAFFSLSPKNKNKIKHTKTKTASLIQKLLLKPNKLLATILVANNFINVAIIILSTYLSTYLFAGIKNEILYILVQLVGVTFLILLFGEMMPKIFASKYPLRITKLMAYPLLFTSYVVYPISYLLIKSTNVVNNRLSKKHNTNVSIVELSQAIELASEELKDDKEMLEGIVNSSQLEVKEIMTSRIDVFAIEFNDKFTKVIGQIIESGFSRIPVYVENLDNIKGVLYIKDVLPYIGLQNKEDFKWQKLLRSHFIVPETKNISDLLTDFQNKKLHIAIVVDEYGCVNGLVTLEDILEEFVGEIQDESDSEENSYVKIDKNNYEFDAKTSIVDFCKVIDADYSEFHDIKGDADTLAGLILEINGEIPVKNDEIKVTNYSFIITAADDRRIKKVKVKINDPDKTNK
ncbi:MAG: gliding motility-associated protein GldE [Bacteroidales bacterium]|nr:gliding motility-associated protein GldE [Bacteroidales bacterium]MDD4216972.1 gliding motility-associated protein GldE [Bacteroidales bacterium]MDY0142235.1 gliding motility-associated protein GldE [Bacteroidales bacterium]